jgi:hypothetical protein
MVEHGYREGLLGLVLSDYVLVEMTRDLDPCMISYELDDSPKTGNSHPGGS